MTDTSQLLKLRFLNLESLQLQVLLCQRIFRSVTDDIPPTDKSFYGFICSLKPFNNLVLPLPPEACEAAFRLACVATVAGGFTRASSLLVLAASSLTRARVTPKRLYKTASYSAYVSAGIITSTCGGSFVN